MTTLRQQRDELVSRLRHAEHQHAMIPDARTRFLVQKLATQLHRLDDLLTAVRHGKVRIGRDFQQADGPFISREEFEARHKLNEDRRVIYL